MKWAPPNLSLIPPLNAWEPVTLSNSEPAQ